MNPLGICHPAVALRRRKAKDKLGLKLPLELLGFAMLAWQEFSRDFDSAELEPSMDY